MNTGQEGFTERCVDGAMEDRLARDARRLLAPFDHHALATRLGADARRRRRRRTSIAAAGAVVVASGFAFWSVHDRGAPADPIVAAQQPITRQAVKVTTPRRAAHPPVIAHDSPGQDLELTTIPNTQAAERNLADHADLGTSPVANSSVVGIPFVIEPAEGSGGQPVFGIYVPGGIEPLNAADLTPVEQRAVYRVLGIQPVSTDSNTL